MKHSMQILETVNYSLFKKLLGNRLVETDRVKDIIEKIKKNSFVVAPIQVNEKFEIIDGQHRFEAWKQLGLPIMYYVVRGATIADVLALNTHDPRWKTQSYAQSYSDRNDENYKLYNEFLQKYGFNHGINIMLLNGAGYSGNDVLAKFRNGEFKIKNYKKACEYAEILLSFKQYYSGYNKRNFVIALYKMLQIPKFDLQTMYQRIEQQITRMVHCVTTKDYEKLLMDIYNYKTPYAKRLKTEDFDFVNR